MRRVGNNNPSPPFSNVAGATFSPPGGARVAGLGRGMTHPTFFAPKRKNAEIAKSREKVRKSLNLRKFQYFRVLAKMTPKRGSRTLRL